MSANPPPSYPPEVYNDYTIAFMGNALGSIFYGIYVVIAVTNLVLLHRKRSRILSLFTWCQLVITTLYVAISLYIAPPQCLSLFGLLGTYGPNALSPWPAVVVDSGFVVNTWFSDAFLLYRCYVVWMGNRFALVVPTVIYLATIGASIAYLWASAHPGAVYSSAAVQAFGRPYWTCSVAMNVVASCLISVRLWYHRRAIMRAVGSHQGQFYISYMAMTLESAVLYTAFGIIALVVFSLNSQLENIFFPILGMIQVIAPGMIINRIARGISFATDKHSGAVTNTLRFAKSPRQMQSIDPDFLGSGGSETVQVSTGMNSKTVLSGDSASFIREEKSVV